MDRGYWAGIMQRRVSRRRALSITGATTFSAAFLAACGGDDNGPGAGTGNSASTGATSGSGAATGSQAQPSLVSERLDTTAAAVPGGVMVTNGASDVALDPHAQGSVAGFGEHFNIYSTPLKWGKALGRLPAIDTITGDAFQSWEISPDGMQVTLTLRPDHNFDSRPPTNGRAMTVEDVKWSWDRSSQLSPVMREVLFEASPAGPLESLETPDANTVVINLAFPYGAITELLSFWYFFIAPPEAEEQLQTDPRGSGPWQIIEHNPTSTGTIYHKNPDWYESGRPFLDELHKLSIPEYAAALAQFETGALWAMDPDQLVAQEDILRVKRDHPEMVLLQKPTAEQPLPVQLQWSMSQREDSPFVDQRLRQAVAHLYDSEAYINTFFNVEQFTSAGLPFETRRETHLPTNTANWIDPRDSAFANGRYFEYDPDEAAKLIQASGFTGTIDMNFRASPASFAQPAEVIFGMLSAGGLDVRLVPMETTDWRQTKADAFQAYSGMFQNTMQAYNGDQALVTKYTPAGRNRHSAEPIPEISDRVEQMQRELDPETRDMLIKQLALDLAPLMLDLPPDSNQPIYVLHQPWLKNYNVFGTVGFDDIFNTSARLSTEFWYDEPAR